MHQLFGKAQWHIVKQMKYSKLHSYFHISTVTLKLFGIFLAILGIQLEPRI